MRNRKIPSTWITATLGEIAWPGRPKEHPQTHRDLPFLGMADVEAQTTRILQAGSCAKMNSNGVHFQTGDVLYGRLRPYLNKVCIPDFEGLCSAEFIVFPRRDTLTPKFLLYLLNTSAFVSFATSLNEGDRPRVDYAQISPYEVILPPLPEQNRIVAEIEKHFTCLDAADSALKHVQANLKRYRASVLKAACEGRLVDTEADLARKEGRDYETGEQLLKRILTERCRRWEKAELEKLRAKGKEPKDEQWKAKYKEPEPPDTTGLPELPEGWVWTTVPMILPASKSGMKTGPFGTLLKKHEHRDEGIPVIGIENIEPMRFTPGSKIHISPNKAAELSGYSLLPGDIVISRSGTVGEVCVVPEGLGEARFSTNVMRVRLLPDGIMGRYLALLINGSHYVKNQIRELCKGSTRLFLNQGILTALVLPFPPKPEQERILDEVDRLSSLGDELGSVSITVLHKNYSLRQSILKRAFEGRLVAQDPTDEPARVLLDRIRAEREAASAKVPKRRAPRRGVRKKKAKNLGPLETNKDTADQVSQTVPEIDTDMAMAAFRKTCRGRGAMEENELLTEAAENLGITDFDPSTIAMLERHFRNARKRRIVAKEGGLCHPGTRTMADYEKSEILEHLRATVRKGSVIEREDLIRGTASRLGFSRIRTDAREILKSTITRALRQGIFEKETTTAVRRLE